MYYFNNSQRVSSWITCQQMAGGLHHSFLNKPHFSNMAAPSQSKHFLWKCETLELNLPPWNREHECSLNWENKCIDIEKNAMGRVGYCLLGRPTDGINTGECWRGGGKKNAYVHLRTFYIQTYTQGWLCVFLRHRNPASAKSILYGKDHI